jgi:hypothetical protein
LHRPIELAAQTEHFSFSLSRKFKLSFDIITSDYPPHVTEDPVAVFAVVSGLVTAAVSAEIAIA